MALFNFGKKKSAPASKPEPKSVPEILWTKSFTQSGTFKGYRRINLSRYFHEEVDKSIGYFEKQGYNLKGSTVQLTCIRFDKGRDDGCRVDIYVNEKLLGTIWQSDQQAWSMLTENEIDKVHVRIEDTMPGCTDPNIVHTRVYLFIHSPA